MTATGAEMMQIIAEKRRLRFISFATLVCRKQGGPGLSNLEMYCESGIFSVWMDPSGALSNYWNESNSEKFL